MVGCWRCTYPSIHFFVSRSRSVVRGAVVCVVCVVCCVGVGVDVWKWCCVGVVCCVVVCVCVFVLFCFFLSILFFLFLALSLSFHLLSLSSLFFRSSLFSSRHQTLWKEPINQHGGQLRGITASAQQSVLSLLLSPPLPPPSSPSPPQKKKEEPLGRDGRQAKADYRFREEAKRLLRYLDNRDDVKSGHH